MLKDTKVKINILIFFIYCLYFFLSNKIPYAFCQGREYLRTRAGSLAAEETEVLGKRREIEYFIAPEDEIEIFVWQNPELTKTVVVGPDGYISHPLIGRIKVAGLSISKLEDKINQVLSEQAKFISIGDEIEIFVLKNPDLTKTVIVDSEGYLSYPPIGRIKVVGLSISELEDKIRQALSEQNKFIFSGDEIEIFVWQNPELSKNVLVGPDGYISYPLIGRIEAAGLTVSQLEEKIKEKLSEYIKSPQVSVTLKKFVSRVSVTRKKNIGQVSVTLKKFAGNKIIILGEVNYPGIYTYKGSLNLIEAIALAGDFTSEAHQRSVILVRGDIINNPDILRVDMVEVITKGIADEEIILQPNDIIYVPRTFVANLNKFIQDISPLINTASDMLGLRREIRNIQGRSR